MKIFDTASHKHIDWSPPQDVGIYVCGITPYDAAHLGHILTFMTYDLLQRYLEDQGHTVTMVRNITDVDEPIYARAAELGQSYTELAVRETASFRHVLERLHFLRPRHEPLASQYIEQMTAAVSRLLESGVAYHVDADIYFDTAQDELFGSFSGFSPKLLTGLMQSRGGDPSRPTKRNPMDFLLWRAVTDPADPAAWTTASMPAIPRGRPGWHIECSVMSAELLADNGGPFELHGGGNDLIFPHHECEIAQTRALHRPADDGSAGTSTVLARRWLHVAPLYYCGEKMSKSLGNLVFARDLLDRHEPSVIRLALMNYHYLIGGEWNPCLLQEAAVLLGQVRTAVARGVGESAASSFAADVRAALANDLDTHTIIHSCEDLAAATGHTADNSEQTAVASISKTLELLGLQLEPELPPLHDI